jgi:hypothetical protein
MTLPQCSSSWSSCALSAGVSMKRRALCLCSCLTKMHRIIKNFCIQLLGWLWTWQFKKVSKLDMTMVWITCQTLDSIIKAQYWQLMPVILATQEAKIKRIMIWGQPGQILCETLAQKYPTQTHTQTHTHTHTHTHTRLVEWLSENYFYIFPQFLALQQTINFIILGVSVPW